MDSHDHDLERIRENLEATQYDRLVNNLRQATHEQRVLDAEGEALTVDLVQDLEHEVQAAGVQRHEAVTLLHPDQMWVLRDSLPDDLVPDPSDPIHALAGIPMLVDEGLPRAVVYVVDPEAITRGGQVKYENRVGRLTGLKHPDADSENSL